MKKGTKFVLFTAAAGAAAYWGSKLFQQIRQQNEELNGMIENATSSPEDCEDYEDLCHCGCHACGEQEKAACCDEPSPDTEETDEPAQSEASDEQPEETDSSEKSPE